MATGWLSLTALSSCAEIEPFELDGSCGNQVLDPGEDCDGAGDPALGSALSCGGLGSTSPCRYRCDAEAQCPSGWGCGADGLCLAPSGELTRGMLLDGFTPDSISVGDLDGDQRIDLVGAFADRIEIAPGLGDGSFAVTDQRTTLRTAFPTSGDVLVTSLDGDDLRDVVLPTRAGMAVWRGQASARPLQVAYTSSVTPIDALWLLPMTHPNFPPATNLALALYSNPDLEGRLITPYEIAEQPTMSLGVGKTLTDLAGEQLAVAQLKPDRGQSVVLPFAGDSEVQVWTAGLAFLGGWALSSTTTIDVASPWACDGCRDHTEGLVVGAGAKLADLDGDLAFDLLVGVVNQDGRVSTVAARGDGDGGFGAPYVEQRLAQLASSNTAIPGKPTGELSAWPLAADDLNGDDVADFVSPQGIFLSEPAPPHALQFFARAAVTPWTGATTADLDGDGLRDVIAFAHGNPGVDVLLSRPDHSFAWRPYPTDGGVLRVRAGQLRAAPGADLVIVEQTPEGEALSVMASDAPDYPREPVRQAVFNAVQHIELGRWVDPLDDLDVFTDVWVTDSRADGTTMVGVLYGDATGNLSAVLRLQEGTTTYNSAYSTGRVALSGRFAPEGASITPDVVFVGETSDGDARAWWLPGATGANFEPNGAFVSLREAIDPEIDLDCAHFGVADVDGDGDGDGEDEIVALFGPGSCDGAGVRLAIGRTAESTLAFADHGGLPAAEDARLAVADLNADGRSDLLIASRDTLSVYWGTSQGLSREPQPFPGVSGERPVAVVTLGHDGQPGAARAALLTDRGLWLIAADLGLTPVAEGSGSALASADVNGDGLADLLVQGEDGLTTWLSVPAPPLGDALR